MQNANPALIVTFGDQNRTNIWMLKIESLGTIKWHKKMGGNIIDLMGSMQQTADTGYIIAGDAASNFNASNGNTNITGFHWSPNCPNCTRHNYFLVKFAKEPVNILPVTLTGFGGILVDKNAQLNCSTPSELDNIFFEVQRNADGFGFSNIGTVDGYNNTSTPRS